MAPRTPTSRGFTLAERRSLTFERVALYAVFFVALVAAVISFVAMRWLGEQLGLGWAAPLIPLAVDGFAIACSVGIVRSQAAGEATRDRFSEWVGLLIALALSITGNVQHVMDLGSVELSIYIKVAFAAAVPVLLAYGIHVYGRAMARGISAHVLADEPDKIHVDLLSLGETRMAKQAAVRTPSAHSARTPITAQPERAHEPARAVSTFDVDEQTTVRAPLVRVPSDRDRARDLFEAAVRADPFIKPDAAAIHREIDTDKSPASTRRWVQSWWDEWQQSIDGEDAHDAGADLDDLRELADDSERASA